MLAPAFACWALTAVPAHFVWIATHPGKDGTKIAVGFGEPRDWDGPLAPKIVGAQCWLLAPDGKRTDVKLAADADLKGFSVKAPKGVFRQAGSWCEYGVVGKNRPRLLWYGATKMLGPSWEWRRPHDPAARAELLARVEGHDLVLSATAFGKPVVNVEVNCFPPTGDQLTLKTDARGEARWPMTVAGEHLAYFGSKVAEAGMHQGAAFAERGDYATVAAMVSAGELSPLPPLPERVTAFGAATLAGKHYIVGGHIGPTHEHSTANLAKTFAALDASSPTRWQPLANDFRGQSVALVAWKDRLIRTGGMRARNAPSEKVDMVSIAEVAAFRPGTAGWTPLTPMPTPRSSHDAALVGDTLFVLGGWNLPGGAGNGEFVGEALTLDLADPAAKWISIPQPFKRRALAVAAAGGKVYALGGINDGDDLDQETDVLDVKTKQWSKGPKLPGDPIGTFGPAAMELSGRLIVSLGDGGNYRLSVDGKTWEALPKLPTPRFLHRLVADGPRAFLALGGASQKQGHVDFVERVEAP